MVISPRVSAKSPYYMIVLKTKPPIRNTFLVFTRNSHLACQIISCEAKEFFLSGHGVTKWMSSIIAVIPNNHRVIVEVTHSGFYAFKHTTTFETTEKILFLWERGAGARVKYLTRSQTSQSLCTRSESTVWLKRRLSDVCSTSNPRVLRQLAFLERLHCSGTTYPVKSTKITIKLWSTIEFQFKQNLTRR